MWGAGTPHASSSDASFFREILDHTMALVSAVRLACMRTMTEARRTAYREYIVSWLQNLQCLHPDVEPRTNFHIAVHIYDSYASLVLFVRGGVSHLNVSLDIFNDCCTIISTVRKIINLVCQ